MGLNTNLQSKTIEEVLAIRKKQCTELADVVTRGLKLDLVAAAAGSVNHAWCLGLQEEARKKTLAIADQPAEAFNDNVHFTAEITETVRLVPNLSAPARGG